MRLRSFSCCFVLLTALGCSASRPPAIAPGADSLTASLVSEGYFDCFERGLEDPDGRLSSCEVSAVAYAEGQLVMGNDKLVPGGSPMTALEWNGPTLAVSPTPVSSEVIQATRKIEAATTTPDGQWVFASTAFDRVREDSAEWNPFNTLIYWPAGHAENAKVAHSSTVDGYESSVSLRAGLQRALSDEEFPEGPPYFKIEALAALPDGQLLFGVREFGLKYDDFRYCVRVISVGYSMDGGELRLDENFRQVYEGDLKRERFGLLGPLGISSLEFDRYGERLFLLTSFELGEEAKDLGAYLWVLPMEDFGSGRGPTPVLAKDGKPFLFAHKAEGMAVIDAETLFIVHDDDRVFGAEKIKDPERDFHREPHQTAWSVVHLD